MERIFSIITAISVCMVILAGGGTYWFSSAEVSSSEKTALAAKAQGLATGMSFQLETLQGCVDGIARSPEVINALSSGDPILISSTAIKLQTFVPGAIRIRLLLPSINEPEQTFLPHMGFGDLDMVRSTLSSKQKPVIQGEGEHRHLALTSAVIKNDQVIGVVLASLKTEIVNQALAKTNFTSGFVEIKQDQIVLASIGNEAAKTDDAQSLPLGDSRWSMSFWSGESSALTDSSVIAVIVLTPALLAGLAFFLGYRKLASYLQHDQRSILKAAKDMAAGKSGGNYPVQLLEMQPIITTIAKLKRIVIQENIAEKTNNQSPIEHQEPIVFEESFDLDYLEENPDAFSEHFENQKLAATATPIAMPQLGNAGFSPSIPSIQSNTGSAVNIFRSYDIRGIVGKDLNAEIITNIGRAVASEAKESGILSIVIGHDGRHSSAGFSNALAEGICSVGCHVIDIGLVPTPLLYFVAHHSDGRTGIMITGSHNPPEYNGLKIVLNGETLATDRIQGIKKRIEAGISTLDEPGAVEQNDMFTDEYIGIICEDIHIARRMKVVVDCGNGAASVLGPLLLKALGCEVVELFCTIDGSFPNHHPDPGNPENMKELIASVKLHNADAGIAFDGDGDRLGVVDAKGNIIWPDRQMMLFARDVLARKPGAEIIYDVKCSRHLHDQILKRGGRPVMWKSGHSLVKAKLKETGAALAGEMSGHIFFNDRWFGFDDALYSSARMVQILSEDMRPTDEVFAELPDSINTPEINIPIGENQNQQFIKQMFSLAHFDDAKIIDIDGMRVEFNDGWGLIRASNTTPSLTLRFEADNQASLIRIQSLFKQLMLQIKPDLSLPF